MSPASSWVVVVLEGASPPGTLESLFGCTVHRAGTVLQAAALLVEVSPTHLVIRIEVGWHRTLISALPPDFRPAIVAVGPRVKRGPLIDGWLREDVPAEESRQRLLDARARARARSRRHLLGREHLERPARPVRDLPTSHPGSTLTQEVE